MMNHRIFSISRNCVETFHLSWTEEKRKKKGTINGRVRKISFMVLQRLDSPIRSDQSINQSIKIKKTFLFETLTVCILPNLFISALPFFLFLSE